MICLILIIVSQKTGGTVGVLTCAWFTVVQGLLLTRISSRSAMQRKKDLRKPLGACLRTDRSTAKAALLVAA